MERAVALCRDGLAKFPNHMSARVTLGWALLDLGKYDEAQAELEQVLRRAPDNLAAIRGLAQLHERAENAVMLPLDGPGAWPPEPETIETAAAASSAVAESPVVDRAPVAPVEAVAPSADTLIVTGRAPAVDVPKEFAPVALTTPAEMASPVIPAVKEEPVHQALAAADAKPLEVAKRAGFLPIQIEPSKFVRPQVFESIVDEDLPIPMEAPAARVQTEAPAPQIVPAAQAVVEEVAAPAQSAAAIIDDVVEEPAGAHASIEQPVVEAKFIEPVIDEPAVVVSAPSTFAAASFVEDLAVEPAVSAFAQPAEAVLDEPITAEGLTGFAGERVMAVEPVVDAFALEPVLDDYVPPPADELAVSEFALSAEAPELQQILALEETEQPYAESLQPQLEAIIDEPVAAMVEPSVSSVVDPIAQAVTEPIAEQSIEPVAQMAAEVEAPIAEPAALALVEVEAPAVAAVEVAEVPAVEAPAAVTVVAPAAIASPAIADVAEEAITQDDPLAFRLTEPVAMAPAIEDALAEEVAGVPEGVLAFDFETPAPVVAEIEPKLVSETEKPVVAEVVSIAARRQTARLVALERFLNRIESRRVELAAQPLAG